MTKADILAELSRLSAEDRSEILARLWRLEEEANEHRGASGEEQAMLDRELAQYETDRNCGTEWAQVETRLRRRHT